MLLQSPKDPSDNSVEIYLTLEIYDRKFGNILFDFADFKSFSAFGELISFAGVVSEKAPSMVMFVNFHNDRRFKEGVYYRFNNENVLNTMDITVNENSSIIAFVVNMHGQSLSIIFNGTGKPSRFEGEAVTLPRLNLNSQSKLMGDYSTLTTLIVRQAKQGSWNEFLVLDEPKIVFDIGTSYAESRSVVKALMSQRDIDYQRSKPNLILSHWDVDHYHMLLEAEDETIKSFSSFIYRDRLPNQTSRRVISRFKSLNPDALIEISPVDPAPKKTSEQLFRFGNPKNRIQIYNGSINGSRNKSGLLITYSSAKMVVICGADFDYLQLDSYILPDVNFQHDHYLIVPHHGGNAGKIVYNSRNAVFKDAIISVGRNSYGHPLFEVTETLKNKKFQLVDLRCKAPYILSLT